MCCVCGVFGSEVWWCVCVLSLCMCLCGVFGSVYERVCVCVVCERCVCVSVCL